jgi:hypothetical protein
MYIFPAMPLQRGHEAMLVPSENARPLQIAWHAALLKAACSALPYPKG